VSTAALERTLDEIARLPQTAMVDAAKAVERIAREVGSTIGPVALGRKGRRVRLSAVTRIRKRGTSDAEATVWGRPTGPWVWVTSGTRPHTIPKARSRGKQRGTRYLKGDSYQHPYGLPVQHPGASGRGAWRTVVRRAEVEVPKVFLDAARRAMRSA
jgi:hypothetical protein